MNSRGYPWVEFAILLLLSVYIVSGAAQVPFHPDESSWLFQSRDLEGLVSDPASLAWRRGVEPDQEMTYRLLNAPLAKYVLGAARVAAGFPASTVESDWHWGKTWEENVLADALPPEGLLHAARRASALLLIPAVIAIYFCGRALGGRTTALVAAILLATNALVLLHGRRSMAEGALTLGVCLALLGLLYADRHPWLAGLAAGLAFSAKTSAAVWIPLGWVAAAWAGNRRRSAGSALARMGAFTLASGLVILVLHPILWAEPANAVTEMWKARQTLVAAQVETTAHFMPWAVLWSPADRLAGLLAHLYFSPLQFAEAGNYIRETAAAEAAYLAVPGSGLLRGILGGAVFLGVGLLGLFVALRKDWRSAPELQRVVTLVLLATVIQTAALAAAVPLAFQRYSAPLVPLACLWAARGLASLIEFVDSRRPVSRPAASGS
jgi:4-amino-4-deoxy-L-arabinose transferase-like glycosyltransferase